MTASLMHFFLYPIIFLYVYITILYRGGFEETDYNALDESGQEYSFYEGMMFHYWGKES